MTAPAWLQRAVITTPYLKLCLIEKDFRRLCRKHLSAGEKEPSFVNARADATTHFFEARLGRWKTIAVVCVKDTWKHSLPEVCGLLAHEAWHVWVESKSMAATDFPPHEELDAIAVGTIAQRLIDEYLRQCGALNVAKTIQQAAKRRLA